MLYLLLGPDDFSKKEYVKSLAETNKLEMAFYHADDSAPGITEMTQQSLFSKSKVFVIEQGIEQFQLDNNKIDLLAKSANQVLFLTEKLDKRKEANKQLSSDKRVKVQEFNLPHGRQVNEWIINRVKFYKGTITPKAAELLAKKIGRDSAKETKFGGKVVEVKEIYSLWQLDNEIKKLLAYVGNKAIEESEVENLVPLNEETDVFEIINAIGDGHKQQVVKLIQKFLEEESGDDKGKIIQLNALLSDQFRSIAVIQDCLNRKMSEEMILDKTSWKSGRLFIMKKIAAKFKSQKVTETLNKLEALDEELKTSNTPPKVLLDLIVSQLF